MSKQIMIIDDSPTMLMSLNGILSKAGLTVVQARNGEEALAILKGGSKPDLIVTDLNMGAMNGIELIRNIRKLSGLQFTPTIVLTTESQQDRRTEAKAAGATGWIVKPVEADALLQVVRQLVPGA
ncbi:response regulator [Magnetospirillum molischianum]|nr:response regulator [Magnetospirillum molischianum]